MDLDELKKMTVPKLRERAKEITDLQGVGGMKKGELIEAIAKAEGISLEAGTKDTGTIISVKQEIQALKKQKEEILSSSGDRSQLGGMRKKIKILKRQTRQMAREAARHKAVQQAQAAAAKAKAAAAPAPTKSSTPEGGASPETGATGGGAATAEVSAAPEDEAAPKEATAPEGGSALEEKAAPSEETKPEGEVAAEANAEPETKPASSN